MHIFYFFALLKVFSLLKNISKALCCAFRDQKEKSISKSTPATPDKEEAIILVLKKVQFLLKKMRFLLEKKNPINFINCLLFTSCDIMLHFC